MVFLGSIIAKDYFLNLHGTTIRQNVQQHYKENTTENTSEYGTKNLETKNVNSPVCPARGAKLSVLNHDWVLVTIV